MSDTDDATHFARQFRAIFGDGVRMRFHAVMHPTADARSGLSDPAAASATTRGPAWMDDPRDPRWSPGAGSVIDRPLEP